MLHNLTSALDSPWWEAAYRDTLQTPLKDRQKGEGEKLAGVKGPEKELELRGFLRELGKTK
jgi:hypothetical protein